jgi:hypothetical protein
VLVTVEPRCGAAAPRLGWQGLRRGAVGVVVSVEERRNYAHCVCAFAPVPRWEGDAFDLRVVREETDEDLVGRVCAAHQAFVAAEGAQRRAVERATLGDRAPQFIAKTEPPPPPPPGRLLGGVFDLTQWMGTHPDHRAGAPKKTSPKAPAPPHSRADVDDGDGDDDDYATCSNYGAFTACCSYDADDGAILDDPVDVVDVGEEGGGARLDEEHRVFRTFAVRD